MIYAFILMCIFCVGIGNASDLMYNSQLSTDLNNSSQPIPEENPIRKEVNRILKKIPENASFYVIRHGESRANILTREEKELIRNDPSAGDLEGGGPYDQLTEVGKKQVEDSARSLIQQDIKFDYVFVSPLNRTQQTARILQQTYRSEGLFFPELITVDSFYEMKDKDLKESVEQQGSKKGKKARSCKPRAYDVSLIKALAGVLNPPYAGGNILIVGHNGTIVTSSCSLTQDLQTSQNAEVYHFTKKGDGWDTQTVVKK